MKYLVCQLEPTWVECFYVVEADTEEDAKYKAFEFLKSRILLNVNDCFKNESNAVVGAFLQSAYSTPASPAVLSAIPKDLAISNKLESTPWLCSSLFSVISSNKS